MTTKEMFSSNEGQKMNSIMKAEGGERSRKFFQLCYHVSFLEEKIIYIIYMSPYTKYTTLFLIENKS